MSPMVDMAPLPESGKHKPRCLNVVSEVHCQNEPVEGKVFCLACIERNKKRREVQI